MSSHPLFCSTSSVNSYEFKKDAKYVFVGKPTLFWKQKWNKTFKTADSKKELYDLKGQGYTFLFFERVTSSTYTIGGEEFDLSDFLDEKGRYTAEKEYLDIKSRKPLGKPDSNEPSGNCSSIPFGLGSRSEDLRSCFLQSEFRAAPQGAAFELFSGITDFSRLSECGSGKEDAVLKRSACRFEFERLDLAPAPALKLEEKSPASLLCSDVWTPSLESSTGAKQLETATRVIKTQKEAEYLRVIREHEKTIRKYRLELENFQVRAEKNVQEIQAACELKLAQKESQYQRGILKLTQDHAREKEKLLDEMKSLSYSISEKNVSFEMIKDELSEVSYDLQGSQILGKGKEIEVELLKRENSGLMSKVEHFRALLAQTKADFARFTTGLSPNLENLNVHFQLALKEKTEAKCEVARLEAKISELENELSKHTHPLGGDVGKAEKTPKLEAGLISIPEDDAESGVPMFYPVARPESVVSVSDSAVLGASAPSEAELENAALLGRFEEPG